MWSAYPYLGKVAWRVAEPLGLARCRASGLAPAADWQRVVDDEPAPDLVVLDDAGLGFREQREVWPVALGNPAAQPWIILKMSRPVAQGALWQELSRSRADRLIVLLTLNDIRRSEVQISRGLSWERTAQDLAWELVYNPRVSALSGCAATVVSLGPLGAFLLARLDAEGQPLPVGARPRCQLFFDAQAIEGEWEQRHAGGMIGYNTCLAAAVAHQLLLAPAHPDLARAIQAGVAAMRRLHWEGYGEPAGQDRRAAVCFPTLRMAAEIAEDAAPLAVAEVRDPAGRLRELAPARQTDSAAGSWTILQDRYSGDLSALSRRIALEGAEVVLRDVPLGRFGELLTLDRREIESLHSVGALVHEYCRQPQQRRPLSIAVFGSPGSGKSFGITQVAKSLLPDQIKVLEFNLSQLPAPADLAAALHQVRDAALGGSIPLVFWDEFDAALAGKPLGWLRYFLAPMQDGVFREGQVSHPIGRAIFVFAGGTSSCLEDFGSNVSAEEFRLAKGTGFVSRLKGYVNVLGPNRQERASAPGAAGEAYYLIRRAVLLRSILKRAAPQLFHRKGGKDLLSIDPGLLRAFLEVRTYKHGARSVEAIVAMSSLWGKSSYERSSLPPETQLDLHVDGREFLALVQRIDLEGEVLERLAVAHHEVFCEGLLAQGKFSHTSLRPFAELPADEQEQNRAAVRDIPTKLAYAGYTMAPARSDEPPLQFPGDEMERLAELEHNRWTKAKLADGWRYAPVTDKKNRLHTCLVPWRRAPRAELEETFTPGELAAMGSEELPEEEKEKDRDLVRGIPRILARAGYAIVDMRPRPRGQPVGSNLG